MEENQRYAEPKKIGEIINDMDIKEKLQKKKIHTLQSKRFADDLMKNLAEYGEKIAKMDPSYVKASKLIIEMDGFFSQENKNLLHYKDLMTQHSLKKKDIQERINAIELTMEYFESIQGEIRKHLRSIANTFLTHDDRNEHNQKINEFCSLFLQIYHDIDDLKFEYDKLRRKIPAKK